MIAPRIDGSTVDRNRQLRKKRLYRVDPLIDALFGFIFGDAISLLDLAYQLFASTLDLIEIIVRQISPLLFDLALELFPLTGHLVPVHAGASFRASLFSMRLQPVRVSYAAGLMLHRAACSKRKPA
jgi:hypothetical protein